MQKKTIVQLETLTYNDRHRVTQIMTVNEKVKRPSFVFLIISATAHLQFSIHTGKHTIPKLRENLLLPTNKWQDNFSTFASLLDTQGSNPILLFKKEIRIT